MTGLRVLVCGGRNYRNAARVDQVLSALDRKHGISVIIHGAYKGADTLAAEWALEHSKQAHSFPADWQAHGKAAGPIRNAEMLRVGRPDAVVAFPGNDGTSNMVEQAKAAGLRPWKIDWE